MAGYVDVAVAPLSRDEILADLRALQSDFGRLFMTDCVANLTTYRRYWPSRFPHGGDLLPRGPILSQPDEAWLYHRVGNGLEVAPLPVRSAEDAATAPIFYDQTGSPLVTGAGHSMVAAPGWSDTHEIKLGGPGSVRANETIDRANRWACDAMSLWWPVLLPDRSPFYVSDASILWPCVVAIIAERARRSLLKPNGWLVDAGVQSYSLDVWRRRDELGLGGPMVTDEVAKEIGDDPEHVYAVRSAFLRDSELAAEWLAEQLAGPVVANDERQDGDAAGKPDGRDVIAATLDAVVKNGLAGVLQLAAGAKASDKVSATMLDMLTTDDNTDRYRWSAEKWVIELGQAGVRCSKKTIIGNRRQGIPPCEAWKTVLAWREANKADRVSSETAK